MSVRERIRNGVTNFLLKDEEKENLAMGARVRTATHRTAAEKKFEDLSKRLGSELATLKSVEGSVATLEAQGFIDKGQAREAHKDLETAYDNLVEAYRIVGSSIQSYHDDNAYRGTKKSKLGQYISGAAANDGSAYGMDKAAIFIFIGALGTIAFLAPSITGAAIGTARLSPTLILPFIFSLITLVGVLLYVRKSR